MQEQSSLVLGIFNDYLLDLEKVDQVPCGIPTDITLAKQFDVSRTTISKVVNLLCEKEIIRKSGSNKFLLRKPRKSDYHVIGEENKTKAEIVEQLILKKLSNYELNPGEKFSELELSKKLKTNTITTREALLKVAQSGIITKQPGQKWKVIELRDENILKLSEARKLYELYALSVVHSLLDSDNYLLEKLEQAKSFSLNILNMDQIDVGKSLKAEELFHKTLVNSCGNNFIIQSYNSIFLLVNYYLYQIEHDQDKIRHGINLHIEVLDALLHRDFVKSEKILRIHLDAAEISMQDVNHQVLRGKADPKTVPIKFRG